MSDFPIQELGVALAILSSLVYLFLRVKRRKSPGCAVCLKNPRNQTSTAPQRQS